VKIDRIEIYAMTKIRYKRVFNISRGIGGGPEMKWGFHVVVKIFTNDGIVGIGEVRPANPYQGETTWSVFSGIERFYGPALIGKNPLDISKITEMMEDLLPQNPYARTPIDLALHDIMGKAFGVPVYRLLGGLYHEKVGLKFPIGVGSPEEVVEQAHQLIAETGTKYIKVKIGPIARLQNDVATLDRLRREFGDRINIQVDANAGYNSVSEALLALEQIKPFKPVLVEQPLPKWDIDGMCILTERLDCPMLADESLWSPQDGFLLLKRRACDILNAKIPKAGGLYRAKMIAAIAEGAGGLVYVGSTGESGIGAAAGIHFHVSTKNMWPVAACLWGPYILVDDLVTDESKIKIQDGFAYPPSSPGLGVDIDEEALRHYSENRATIC